MNYKELIFSAIGDKFTEANIDKVFFNFNVVTGKSKLYAIDINEKSQPLEITTSENITIKMLFINKTVKQLKKDFPDKEVKSIIVEIVVSTKEFNIFIEFTNDLLLYNLTNPVNNENAT